MMQAVTFRRLVNSARADGAPVTAAGEKAQRVLLEQLRQELQQALRIEVYLFDWSDWKYQYQPAFGLVLNITYHSLKLYFAGDTLVMSGCAR